MSTPESKAVAIARAHIEAWSNHDFEAARKGLAADVHVTATSAQPGMLATNTTGADRYMEGLMQFAQAVIPGSAHVVESVGDDRNALILVSVKAAFGPDAPKMTITAARLYQLDNKGQIGAEQVIFYATPA